jgi:hypothetical protein
MKSSKEFVGIIPESEILHTIHTTSTRLMKIKESVVDKFVELGAVKVAFLKLKRHKRCSDIEQIELHYDLVYASLISQEPKTFEPPRIWSQYFIDSHQFFNLRS